MTRLVGILNITPDSFSDGGLYDKPKKALEHAAQLFAEGADIVDVGAESTRPNAPALSHEEEWLRLEPILATLMQSYPGKVSLDTRHPETAAKALEIGDVIINDVTGMQDPAMVRVVGRYKPIVIVSQMPARNAQDTHAGQLLDDIIPVKHDLLKKREELLSLGMQKDAIILDPGIGFGKTPELNQKLLRFAEEIPDSPIMIGYSKKRFLGEQRMEPGPNLAAGSTAIDAGAAYLRVHDVAGHRLLLY